MTAFYVGKLIVTSMLSPFGLIIGGIAGVVTAIAYFAGAGNSASERIINSFKRVWDFLKLIVNNTSSLSQAWSALLSSVGFLMLDAWINVKASLFNLWINIKSFFINVWTELGDFFVTSWYNATAFVEKLFVSFGSFIDTAVRDIGDGWVTAWIDIKEQLGMITKQEADEQRRYIADMNKKEADAANQEVNRRKQSIDAQNKANQDYLANYKKTSAEINAQAKKDDKAVNEARRQQELGQNKKDKDAFEAKLKADFEASGKSSLMDKVEEFYKKLKEGMGIDDLLQMAEKIKQEALRLKDEANKRLSGDAELPDSGKEPKQKKGKNETSLEDTFMKRTAFRLAAADELKAKEAEEKQKLEEDRKAQLEEQRRMRELQERQVEETQKTNKIMEEKLGKLNFAVLA